ncbi:hypothetical protein DPEC_G00188570 [Dallia pectoralis]|uniref:Uncharacterized protein n=1 Tax=Dallia pectoralis TaxID=75939 RepID=A0ACC2GC80_DALPE|nr:hypothetical protein DPEC_G00188570 [Dallia pectoralis]
MAGRMIGHSFLHDGPQLAGLSPAILHVLFGGTPETATVTTKDCADLDIRETIESLHGTADLTEDQTSAVTDLALSWDLPGPTQANRRWLTEKLLIHSVLGRTCKQVKQLRSGLKETGIWPLLSERSDVVLFPAVTAAIYTPQMVLERINWPPETVQSDEDSGDCSLESKCLVTGYLRRFIETASPDQLKDLLTFWVGWEVQLFKTAATCFEKFKIPGRCRDYHSFEEDLLSSIASSEHGFGLL